MQIAKPRPVAQADGCSGKLENQTTGVSHPDDISYSRLRF